MPTASQSGHGDHICTESSVRVLGKDVHAIMHTKTVVRAGSFAIVLAAIIGSAGSCRPDAQTSVPQSHDTATPYRIAPGDVLSIEVVGYEEWDQSTIVRPDGRISYRATGEIEVAGMTVEQLREILYDAIGPGGRHLKSPRVVVNVTTIQMPTAHVVGAVVRPGACDLPRGRRSAKQAISFVGGALEEADLTRVVVHRNAGTREVIDLQAQMAGEAADTYLHDGDQMVVPKIERFVGVIGVAGHSGQIALELGQESISLSELLVKVGGIPSDADEDRALILRADGAIDDFNPSAVLRCEHPPVELLAGDVLWVLPRPDKEFFTVTGAVSSSGRFEFQEELTLADALALAGQLSEAADTGDIRILRADGHGSTVDIRPLLSGEDTDIGRLPIQPGDIVLVPVHTEAYAVLGAVTRPGAFQWQEDMTLIEALAQAGGIREEIALMSDVTIVRQMSPGEEPIILTVDAHRLLRGQPDTEDYVLLPDDIVYVPTKKKTLRSRLDTPLTLLGMGATLLRLFGH